MRLGLMLPIGAGALGEGRTARWADLREMARTAEAVGFERLFVPDHLLFRLSPSENHIRVDMPEGRTRGIWEAWTILAALAEATQRIHLGPLVACSSFRNPAVFAKMADTLDEVSGGRLVLGLGSGWHEPEYHAFGMPYDHRVSRFEEALQIIVPLLREGRVDFEGEHYQARDCELSPRGPRPQGLPILIGAIRPRMMRLTAQYADIYDADYQLDPGEVVRRFADLDAACAKVGRDPSTLQRTAGVRVALAAERPQGMPSAGDGLAVASYDGMRQTVRFGDVDTLHEHVSTFAAVGVEHLTIALAHPAGPRGIEALAPLVARVHG
ncbi:MAG: LLM class flavin-dependent oxidoreductase [Chromatiales bacterium]|nr:LLM class flavin-dependent oxidoreductase [Chromatiales bacterium]